MSLRSPGSLACAAILLLAPLLAGHGAVRAAEETPTVMILVDGSGSMWGKLPGDQRAKIEAARDALRQTVARIRPEVSVGLASFGHRRRGSCSDAEILLLPEPNAAERLAGPLEKMSALGKGPLVQGLRATAEAIGAAQPASIVLIHDNLDNCGQDVCAAVADIAKANPRLSVHTVSLGLGKADLQQMSCVAQRTGGKLYDVQDAAGIATALQRIVELARLDARATAAPTADAAVPESPAKPAPDAPPGLYLSAGLGPSSATLESPVRWRVTRAGDGGELVREANAPTLVEKLAPGAYEVEARLGLAAARETVEVAADAPTSVRINLNAGVLKMLARAVKDGPPLPMPVFTVSAASGEAAQATSPLWIGREAQPEIVLPAGDYRVSVEHGPARQEQVVKIAAATGTTLDATLATGRLELSAARGSATAPGETVSDGITYFVYEDDPGSPEGRREVIRTAAPAPKLTLPAGTYYVTAQTSSGAEVREQIALGPGDVVQRTLPLALAHVELTATLGGEPPPQGMPLVFTVVRLDAEPREVVRTLAQDLKLDLSAGRYRLEAVLGTTNVKAATEVELAAGESQKVALKLEAGRVTLRLAGGRSAAAGEIYWEVKDGQGTVLRTSQPEPEALLGPGRYVVTAQTTDRRLRSAFEVKPGEHRTFEIGG